MEMNVPGFDDRSSFREILALTQLMEAFGEQARLHSLGEVTFRGERFPLRAIVVGSRRPTDPCLAIFAGVHGLERIGSEVALSYMHTVLELMRWDQTFLNRLQRSRLVFMPIVNPVGIVHRRRSNGNGVDLMRNAPVEADSRASFFVGGHRLSRHLPWYRGAAKHGMEAEADAVCRLVEREVFPSTSALAIDIHSGFGSLDRLWFPYAKSAEPPQHLAEIFALRQLFNRSHPYHFYRIEPTSKQYTIHGDLWDYLYDRHRQSATAEQVFLPWTLEMGSWLWLKKNPLQILQKEGVFHPTLPHRRQRILRRHHTLFDFFHRALLSRQGWVHEDDEARCDLERRGRELWYRR